jgi:serine/threonine protein kinase/tetratricopeptide (TPR) repeat protein
MTLAPDPAFWNDVEAIFSEALALDPLARAQLLATRCGDRADLRAEVQSLLEAHDRATAFMGQATVSSDARADVFSAGLREGDTVGAFRLVSRIATGGMGTVYVAERVAGDFTQRIAVKVIAAPLTRESDARRFRTERQILASLRHPYIVSLIDGGVTPRGEAFLAMELVDGVPITRYCRDHGLDLRTRLELFRQICDAVHHAHARFIVHRDLKPANILVTADGVPKVLDFGVAKLLEDPLAEGRAHSEARTEAGVGPLTPGYASPEQMRGLPITTASDIYTLGVVLYELLTGTRPYETAGKPFDEVMRLVVDADTTRPSLSAPNPEEQPPYDWRRALNGDLDAIVLKALRKDPGDRYASVDALSKDVERYLNGRPVEARVPSTAYVARKLIARHKVAFASAGLSMLVVVGALGVALWQARMARVERDKARAEAAKARTATAFLGRVFQSANPVQTRGQTVTARELLDAGTASIASELQGQPDVQASLLIVMAQAYDRIGMVDRAVPLAEQALALRERSNAPPAELSDALFVVGSMYRRQGRPRDGVAPLERSVRLREASVGPDDPELARSLSALALCLEAIGRPEGVLDMIRRAIRIQQRADPKSAALALLYNNLATVLHRRGDLAGARDAYEQSIAVYNVSTETANWGIAMPLLNVGTLLREREEIDAARPYFERALDIDKKIFGPESAATAYTLACLGDLARARGDLKAAHELLGESLRIYGVSRKPDHIDLVAPLTYLAQTDLTEGRPREALPLLERALAISEKAHGPDHSAVAEVLVDLAAARAAANGAASGEAEARRALAIERKTLAPTHVSLVRALTTLGRLMIDEHRNAEARPYLEEAVRIATAQLPEHHSWRVDADRALRDAQ